MDLVEATRTPARRHPWEVARFRFFAGVLRGAALVTPGLEVLDVGAGDGWFSRELASMLPRPARIACWDAGYTDSFLADRGSDPGPVAYTRARPAGTFGLVLLLDVLEHVEDDGALLGSIVQDALASRGHALVSVPAWPGLFSSHDVHLRHRRRYTPSSVRGLVRRAGLEIASCGGLFHSLLVPRALRVLRERLLGVGAPPADLGEWSAPAAVDALARAALSWDARVSLLAARVGLDLPGLSYWALCRRSR